MTAIVGSVKSTGKLIRIATGWAIMVAACVATVVRAETPAVFWASDPVRPGEVVIVQGG